jgi:hypothetical protein
MAKTPAVTGAVMSPPVRRQVMRVILVGCLARSPPPDAQAGGSVPRLAGAQVHLTSNQEFLDAALGRPRRFHYASRDKLHVVSHPAPGYRRTRDRSAAGYEPATVSLGIQAIHQAFAAHVPLSLTPDLLWYMIVHEVAEYVRQNPGRHAAVFTGMPESRQAIVVRDDSLRRDEPSDWQRSVNLVREPLRAMIGGYTMDLFLPAVLDHER